jgi:hypothetical protein
MPVASELAQQRLRVPQNEVRLVGPVQRGMGGEQGATFEAFAGDVGGTAGEDGDRSPKTRIARFRTATKPGARPTRRPPPSNRSEAEPT